MGRKKFYEVSLNQMEVKKTMFRTLWIVSILFVSVAVLPVLGLAAEHGGQEQMGGTMAAPSGTSEQGGTSTASTAAPEQGGSMSAPAATSTPVAPAPPALKPIVITFSGDLASIDAKTTPATITVQDRYGVRKEIALPGEAKIAQGSMAKTWSDLKTGDKLTVEYTYDVATGKRTAQSVMIGESSTKEGAAPVASAPASSSAGQ